MNIGVNTRVLKNAKTGIPYFVNNLYEELLKIDKNNRYIFFRPKKKSLIDSFLFDNIFVSRKIEENKLNIFHAPANILPFFKRSKTKYVVTIHDLSYLVYSNHHSPIFNLYYKYFVGKSLNNADIVVADSKNTKKDIIKYYRVPKEKIKVIYLGINNFFLKSQQSRRLVKEKYIFTLTTHPERKNTVNLLRAMIINRELLNFKLVIAGLINDDHLQTLKNEIKKLGLSSNVFLWGYAKEKNLVSLYQHAEFFVYPSFYEGFGLPVLESMVCKCPVITSNNSSLIEITPDKTWLVNPHNLIEMGNKMRDLLELSKDKKIKLVDNNYHFAKKFTWYNTAKQYLKVFNDLNGHN